MAKVTIKQVAERAGVSTAAVSRFLGGTLELPETTASRIRDAVVALDYAPNANARRLRNGRTEALGFVAPEISNPFFSIMASAVGARAWELGLDLMVWSSDDVVEREVASLQRLKSSYIDGLLLITHHKSDEKLIENLKGVSSLVLIDEDIADVAGSRVFVENEYGGWLATKTLADLGHKRIAHVGSPAGLMSAELRQKGWIRALAEAGLEADPELFVCGAIDPTFGKEALIQLMNLPSPPTAIFVGSDPIAFGIIAASRSLGLQIPDDLSLISFDGLPVGEIVNPALSTIVQPITDMGRKGVDMLVRRIERPTAPYETVVLPVSLEMRASAAQIGNRRRKLK